MHINTALAFVVVVATSALTGCAGEAVGCDFRNVDADGLNNGDEPRCQERSGIGATGFGATCEGLGGDVKEGGCDTDGIVFGCDLGDSGTDAVIDWYYAPKTAADAELDCGGDEIVEAP